MEQHEIDSFGREIATRAAGSNAAVLILRTDLAALVDALKEADAIINDALWESPSGDWMARVNASFIKSRDALAKVAAS
jgi:hypothetical protein